MSEAAALSLGWRSDLVFARFDGEVVDRGNHLLVRTPGNPTFWWGNFLLFAGWCCRQSSPTRASRSTRPRC
jgi:hypothetical protein